MATDQARVKEPLPPAKARPPLGLPYGSVRAILTLLIVAVVIVQIGRGREVELLWTETLMIALAHYFTSRRFIRLPPEVIRRLPPACPLSRSPAPLSSWGLPTSWRRTFPATSAERRRDWRDAAFGQAGKCYSSVWSPRFDTAETLSAPLLDGFGPVTCPGKVVPSFHVPEAKPSRTIQA